MNAFSLRDRVVQDYADYVRSFLKIRDPLIEAFVSQISAAGVLWPDALVQLNPAYEHAATVRELARQGRLDPLVAQIFQAPARDGSLRSLRLYRH